LGNVCINFVGHVKSENNSETMQQLILPYSAVGV
jgi:hypothetical protein